MGFWQILDDFWSPLEDMVDECCERRERQIKREIREERRLAPQTPPAQPPEKR